MPKSELIAWEHGFKEPSRKVSKKKKKKHPVAAPAPAASAEPKTVVEPQHLATEGDKLTDHKRASDAPELVTGDMYEDMGAEITVEPQVDLSHTQQFIDHGLHVDEDITHVGDDDGAMRATLFPLREQATEIAPPAHQAQVPVVHEIGGSLGHRRKPSEILDAVPVRMTAYYRIQVPIELPTSDRRAKAVPQHDPDSHAAQGQTKTTTSDQPRETSTSPRTALSHPTETLAVPVRHSPPPRSVSPIKPALKQSTSPNRASSVSDNGSEASLDQGGQPEQAPTRKKSVRVSFDDKSTVVVGEAAPQVEDESPATSPQSTTRRHWYNLGRRREGGSTMDDVDDGEVMKPRPPLPHFGSIRDKKLREIEERPLVRPPPVSHIPHSGSPTILPTIPSVSNLRHSTDFSNDHAIGSILTREVERKNEANISRLREPLPPEVTSVEGDGFLSDGSSTTGLQGSEDEDEDSYVEGHVQTSSPAVAETVRPSGDTVASIIQNGSATAKGHGAGSTPATSSAPEAPQQAIPKIAISLPSPQIMEEPAVSSSPAPPSIEQAEPVDIPGSFPGGEDSSSTPTPQLPPATDTVTATATIPPVSSTAEPPLDNVEDDSESTSIYSDAYEDLSDIEGDGFLSLNAVVDSPVPPKVVDLAGSPAAAVAKDSSQPTVSEPPPTQATVTQATAAPVSLPQGDVNWEHAKAYWRSLSAEKRRQLEQEALSEAGEDGDLDEKVVVAKKHKKKKGGSEQRSQAKESSSEERVYQIPPGTKVTDAAPPRAPILRSSMRGSLRASTSQSTALVKLNSHGRESLRGVKSPTALRAETPSGGALKTGFRKTMRPDNFSQIAEHETTTSRTAKGERPLSLQLDGSSVRVPNKLRSGQAKRRTFSLQENIPSDSPGNWPLTLAQRRGSMDSESSFQRTTRPRQSEVFGFRRSMRTSGIEEPSANEGTESKKRNSFRFRSSSPNGTTPSHPPISAETRMIRTTMRADSSDGSVHSISQRFRLPFFGRSKKKGDRGSRTSSRLDYSSDDEDEHVALPTLRNKSPRTSSESWVARRFSSSSQKTGNGKPFAASSAAAAAAKGRPLSTGTLREPVEEVSEELSDSSDDEEAGSIQEQPAQVAGIRPAVDDGNHLGVEESVSGSLRRSRSGRGSIAPLQTGSANGAPANGGKVERHKRHSLMAVLRRKKTDQAGRIKRPERMDSAARRDTKLERSAAELEAIHAHTASSRHHHHHHHHHSPNSLGTRSLGGGQSSKSRPSTATQQPQFDVNEDSDQVSTSTPVDGEEEEVVAPAPQAYLRKKPPVRKATEAQAAPLEPRKKKFAALRRMFGIDD